MRIPWNIAGPEMNARYQPVPSEIGGWSIDTRSVLPGDLFFALRGPNHDGHDYAIEALSKGAIGVVVERPVAAAEKCLVVEDTLTALQALASYARRSWGGHLIGVTGSAGKTTTKDLIAAFLATRFSVGSSSGNLNNHVGVPLSILRLPEEATVVVLEMGMNHAGEIRRLCEIAAPNTGVVTNVGYAHVESFRSIEDVALAKRELIEGLLPGGAAVLNADDPRVARFRQFHPWEIVTFGLSPDAGIRAVNVDIRSDGTRFEVAGVPFECPLAGRHALENVLAGLAVAHLFDVPLSSLTDAVRALTPGRMRGQQIFHNGITIIDDCYNANPDAVRAMLGVLKAVPAGRRVAVLGEMLELGVEAENLHRALGRYAAESGVNVLVGVRGLARFMVEEAVRAGMVGDSVHFFENVAEAGDFARGLLREGDVALFKGSRGVAMERALERVLA